MEEYEVMVTESKQYMYEVEASSKEEAVKKVYKDYYEMQERMDVDDSIRVDFEVDGEEFDIDFGNENEYGSK